MGRVSVGNFYGAKKLMKEYRINPCIDCEEKSCEKACVRKKFAEAVNIKEINSNLTKI